MTGLEILLYVYLAGWFGASGYYSYQCEAAPPQVFTKTECHVIGAVIGGAWPYTLIKNNE